MIGVTALIYLAKGLPIGQLLSIIFCILYGICAITYKYYGELATYALMSLPAAIISFIVWMKKPYSPDSTVIKIEKLNKLKLVFCVFISIIATIIFYFILKVLSTPNLIISTISILTSMLACSFLILRSPLYAIFYSFNDVVLIVLWALASITNIIYINLVFCFLIFLINDLYGYINWHKIKKSQQNEIID